MVTSGKIYRNCGIRLIREGVVVFSGNLNSLKRFKDDVKEVSKGYDLEFRSRILMKLRNLMF